MHLVTSSFSESMRCVLKCETSQVETVADTSLNDMPVYGVQRAIFSIKWNEYTIEFRLEQVLEGISFFTIMLKQFNILKQFGNGGK